MRKVRKFGSELYYEIWEAFFELSSLLKPAEEWRVEACKEAGGLM